VGLIALAFRCAMLGGQAEQLHPAETTLVLIDRFLTFAPSLSWQNDRI